MSAKTKTYIDDQYDEIEQLLDEANHLIRHPNTRREGMDVMKLADLKIKREAHRMAYASMTKQEPNIPPLEPAPKMKQLKA